MTEVRSTSSVSTSPRSDSPIASSQLVRGQSLEAQGQVREEGLEAEPLTKLALGLIWTGAGTSTYQRCPLRCYHSQPTRAGCSWRRTSCNFSSTEGCGVSRLPRSGHAVCTVPRWWKLLTIRIERRETTGRGDRRASRLAPRGGARGRGSRASAGRSRARSLGPLAVSRAPTRRGCAPCARGSTPGPGSKACRPTYGSCWRARTDSE